MRAEKVEVVAWGTKRRILVVARESLRAMVMGRGIHLMLTVWSCRGVSPHGGGQGAACADFGCVGAYKDDGARVFEKVRSIARVNAESLGELIQSFSNMGDSVKQLS